MERKTVFAVSGVKNSGKTTFLNRLIRELSERGIRTAVIKHDGHSFGTDVPGTDTRSFQQSGAVGTAVLDSTKYLLFSREAVSEQQFFSRFPNADLILLEGFKHSSYPKFEIVRTEISRESICEKEHLQAVFSDGAPTVPEGVPVYDLNDVKTAADLILEYAQKEKEESLSALFPKCKLILYGDSFGFGPGCRELLRKIEEKNSIRAAAMDMKLSYSKAWKMVKRMEEVTGIEFLVRNIGGNKGGNSQLTEKGKMFLQRYEEMLEEMNRLLPELFHDYFDHLL